MEIVLPSVYDMALPTPVASRSRASRVAEPLEGALGTHAGSYRRGNEVRDLDAAEEDMLVREDPTKQRDKLFRNTL